MDSKTIQNSHFEPMVSIVIPVYNGSNYLREAIDSAIAQTYKNLEIIVVNDGSNDNGATEKIALSYGSKIRYFSQSNGGVSSALNTGIQNMRGEYFSWLSHDDVYHPEKIEAAVAALSTLSDKATIIKCRTEYINASSRLIKGGYGQIDRPCIVTPWNTALLSLYGTSAYNGCALLIHKSVFEKCGLFDESYRYIQDILMWTAALLQRFSVYPIPYIGVKSRIHSGQLTRKGLAVFHSECERSCDYLLPKLITETNSEYRYVLEYAKYHAKHRNWGVIQKVLKRTDVHSLSLKERVIILLFCGYGIIRVIAKKTYYRFFRHINMKG